MFLSIKTIFSYNFLKVLIYFLFVFSGLIKWISLPIDITLLFAFVGIIIVVFEITKIRVLKKSDQIQISLILVLLLMFIISNVYTISSVYAKTKTLAMILNFFTVLYPIIVFKKSIFTEMKYLMYIIGFLMIIILFYFYQKDMFTVLFFGSSQSIENVPTYLSIGILLSACFIFSLADRISFFTIIYRISILFLLLQLGGRGPLLNLFFSLFLFFLLNLKSIIVNYKRIFLGIISFIVFVLFLDSIIALPSTINLDRFNIFEASKQDESFLVRYSFLGLAWNAFLEQPFLGYGIGSGGLILRGVDLSEYPHNLFVEALMELGILGGIVYALVYIFFFIKNFKISRVDKNLRILYLLCFLFFLEDNKSGSFDAWRIALSWIMIFIMSKNSIFVRDYQKLA